MTIFYDRHSQIRAGNLKGGVKFSKKFGAWRRENYTYVVNTALRRSCNLSSLKSERIKSVRLNNIDTLFLLISY